MNFAKFVCIAYNMKRIFYDFSTAHFVGRKRLNLAFSKRIVIVLLLAALLGVIAYFCFTPKSVFLAESKYYYAISSICASEASANENAEQIRVQGGAGLVIYDHDYLVAVFVYPEKLFAQKVTENLGDGAFVYTSYRAATKLRAKNFRHVQIISNAIGVVEYVIQQIYSTVILLEKSETTVSVAENIVYMCDKKLKSANEKLGKIKKWYSGNEIENLIEKYDAISLLLEDVCSNLSELKLILCKMVQVFVNFTNKTAIV